MPRIEFRPSRVPAQAIRALDLPNVNFSLGTLVLRPQYPAVRWSQWPGLGPKACSFAPNMPTFAHYPSLIAQYPSTTLSLPFVESFVDNLLAAATAYEVANRVLDRAGFGLSVRIRC